MRKQRQPLQQLRQRLAAAHTHLQHLQGGHDAVARGLLVQNQQMARALAAERPALALQLFEHVAVAHWGAPQRHPFGLQGQLDRHIGHERTHHTGHHFVAPEPVVGQQIQQLVAVVEPALGVDQQQAVGVAIERNAKVGAVLGHCRHQRLRVRGPHFEVDVVAVGLAADLDHLGPKLVKHLGRDVVGGPMRRIDDDFEPAQAQLGAKGALAKLDVAPGGVV